MKRREFVKLTLAGAAARDTITARGGFVQTERGILVRTPTKTESEMILHEAVACP